MKQLSLSLPTWGGKRKGAGRKPNGPKAGVSHLRRERLPSRYPVHVTMRMLEGGGYLRGGRRHRLGEDAARRGADPCASAGCLVVPPPPDAPVTAPRTWLLRHTAATAAG